MDDEQRRSDDQGDSPMHRTTTAQNAERMPEPATGEDEGGAAEETDAEETDAEETGEKAAEQTARLESHSRPTTEPQEPGAPHAGGTPPRT